MAAIELITNESIDEKVEANNTESQITTENTSKKSNSHPYLNLELNGKNYNIVGMNPELAKQIRRVALAIYDTPTSESELRLVMQSKTILTNLIDTSIQYLESDKSKGIPLDKVRTLNAYRTIEFILKPGDEQTQISDLMNLRNIITTTLIDDNTKAGNLDFLYGFANIIERPRIHPAQDDKGYFGYSLHNGK